MDVCMWCCCGFCPAVANYHIGFGARCKHDACKTESSKLTCTTAALVMHTELLSSVGGEAVTSSACLPLPAAHLPGAVGIQSTALSTCKRNSSSPPPEPPSANCASVSFHGTTHGFSTRILLRKITTAVSCKRRSGMSGDCMLASGPQNVFIPFSRTAASKRPRIHTYTNQPTL